MRRPNGNWLTAFAGLAGLTVFVWPLFAPTKVTATESFTQTMFMIFMPLLLALMIWEQASGRLNSRQIAILGVLVALNSVVRMLGAGTAGIETAFFLIVIAGYVFGAGFGFLMGALSLLVSALVTGGVGPWLPFQMMAAGLFGLVAGLLPKSKKTQIRVALLGTFGVAGSYLYGALMTLWNWPYLAGLDTDVSMLPGAGPLVNLERFVSYEIVTGGLLWDTGRAVTTLVLVCLTAPALLATLDRAARRARLVSRV